MKLNLLFLIFIASVGVSTKALGETTQLNLDTRGLIKAQSYLISIDSSGQHVGWAQDLCQTIHAGLNSISIAETTCHKLTGAFVENSVVQARQSGLHDYQLSIQRIEFPFVLVTVNNWKKEVSEEFTSVSFKMDFTDQEKFFNAIYRLARNVQTYELKKEKIINDIDSSYSTTKDVITYKGEKYEGPKNYRRLMLEIGAVFGFGAYWYYSDATNENDWDFKGLQAFTDKLNGKAVRFDDNSKFLNVGHAFAGMLYQQIGRSNGFTQGQAFFSSFVFSAFWEGVIEYREVLSINDTIHTGLSGPVIGEVFYQMARSLRDRDSFLAEAFSMILDGPTAVNSWLDRNKNLAKHDADYSDSLRLEIGLKDFTFKGDVWSLPEGDQVVAFLPQGFHTQMKAGVRFEGRSIDEFELLTKIAFMGYMNRQYKKTGENSYEGFEFIVSPASEFEWNDRSGDDSDFLVHARVLGATVMVTGQFKGFTVKANYDFYGNFAMLRSYALNEYKKENSLVGFAGIVEKEEYYYGFGTTHKAGLSVNKGRVTVGADYQKNNIQATQSRDRYQEDITKDFKARDRYDRLKFWLQFQITPRLSAEISTEKIDRAGELYAYHVHRSERRTTGRIIFKF